MKTKIILMLIVVLVFTGTAFSQKEMLNKAETVTYLNKKTKEIIGHSRSVSDLPLGVSKLYYRDNSIRLSEDLLIITLTRASYLENPSEAKCDNMIIENTKSFNPANIISVEKSSSDVSSESIGNIIIKFKGKLAKEKLEVSAYSTHTDNGGCRNWDTRTENSVSEEIILVYVKEDPTNFEKIKKALLHLRDLAKAEDDPFGN